MAEARIVIVNFNAGENLLRCMTALSAQIKTDFEVRIVDNASTDGSLRYVPDDDRFLVIHAGSNVGFAAGCNLDARDCAAPFVVMLNPDAFPEPGWLEALLRTAKSYPDATMFGSLQISATDENILDGVGDCYSCFGAPWRGGYGQPVKPLPDCAEAFSPCAAAAMYRTEWFARGHCRASGRVEAAGGNSGRQGGVDWGKRARNKVVHPSNAQKSDRLTR